MHKNKGAFSFVVRLNSAKKNSDNRYYSVYMWFHFDGENTLSTYLDGKGYREINPILFQAIHNLHKLGHWIGRPFIFFQ